jgi:peptidoglycan hydrolase-like protein with peptidoglycan-binding domain
MGYTILVDGIDGTETRKVIAEYQKTQRSPYTLYADGVWGHRTEAHYKWTVALQTAVNKWKSDYRKLSIDGHYGANTVAYVRNVQKRNYGGKYKGAVDGIPGRVFCRMIGITTHP